MKKITADNGSLASYIDLAPVRGTNIARTVNLQGDANDFVWEIKAKLPGAAVYTAMTDGGGNSSFTGMTPMTFEVTQGAAYRVEVTDLGTATEIVVSES